MQKEQSESGKWKMERAVHGVPLLQQLPAGFACWKLNG